MKLKKIILICLMVLLTSGCGKFTVDTAIKEFTSDVNNSKSYKLKGAMEIINNEETFTYSLEANYLKDDYYKVVLVNQTNNHEQIILRNGEGVFVVTPSLNKSFKFQSEWPFNSSQAYILASLVSDIKNDDKVTLEESENNYILKSKVNYPNNTELTYQKIYFDKKMNIESVDVYSNDDIAKIKVSFTSVDLKAGLDKDDFILDDLIDEECCKETTCQDNECQKEESANNQEGSSAQNTTTSSSTLENIIYPLYIPANTKLKNSEKIDTYEGDRVILTFAGEKDFVLIEEVANASSEFEIIPVYGDPMMVADTVAAMSANSLSWSTNNIDYYLASNSLSQEEMLTIASSLGNGVNMMESK